MSFSPSHEGWQTSVFKTDAWVYLSREQLNVINRLNLKNTEIWASCNWISVMELALNPFELRL